MKKIIASVLALALVLISPLQVAFAAELVENSESAILIEAQTGQVLFELNADEQLAPASMTKMMSMYLIMEAITDGRLNWDDMITVSENAAGMGGSQIYLEPGEVMSVHDLFLSVAIGSANDSVTALGEAVAGTEGEFVKLMNERAAQLGMENTSFGNPSGLPSDENACVSTARDMAILAARLAVEFPEVLEFTSIYEDYLRENTDNPFWLVNTNKLVRYVEGLDGLKTGFTREAGYCLAATAQRGEMRVVAVVMGADRPDIRNREISNLIEHAFARYELHPRIGQGEAVGSGHNVLAQGRHFDVITQEPVVILQAVGAPIGEESHELTIHDHLEFPVEPGTQIGTLSYYIDGNLHQEVPLTVTDTLNKTSIISLWSHLLGNLFFGR